MEKPQLVTSSLLLWFLLWNLSEVKVAWSCPTLFDSMDHTVQGILQARILEWVTIPLSGDLPNPGIELRSPALQANSSPAEPQGKPKSTGVGSLSLLQGSSRPRNWTRVSCTAGRFFTSWAIREAYVCGAAVLQLSLVHAESRWPSDKLMG